MFLHFAILNSLLLTLIFAHPAPHFENLKNFNGFEKAQRTCGYQSCPKVDPIRLNVHLIPHTHDDVGWLKTVNQYYTGNKPLTQKAGVNYIIDSIVFELLRDPNKRFIYVESAFFHMWWHEQDAQLQDEVRMLVSEGRLEFIGGAWSMNDEAATHYQSIVDHFTFGLKFLNDTFGECGRPKIGWQIDPFGHAREQASLFAQMGYDGLFFSRLDYQDKGNRRKTKTMEMVWHASPNLGEQSDLFTGVLYNHYSAPPGFCFDYLCTDDPIIDNPDSPEYNLDVKLKQFYKFVEDMSLYYRTNNLALTMGDDFNYQSANFNYKNMDKLIKHINERKTDDAGINIFYSTPSCYLKSLHDANITWPEKTDDFFPYSSDPHAFWTGYFTSRPTQKRYERMGNHFLQVCKQLSSIAPVHENSFERRLDTLRDAMGMMQHHDAITGTEKQHVADDYARLLHAAINNCGDNAKSALAQFSTGLQPDAIKDKDGIQFDSCLHLNISVCNEYEDKQQFTVTVYNALAHSREEYIRVPVSGFRYLVQDYRGQMIEHQVVPISESVIGIHHRKSKAAYEIVFMATEIPPLGYKSFFISKVAEKSYVKGKPIVRNNPKVVEIGNDNIKVRFEDNGFISNVVVDGIEYKFSQNFVLYEGAVGNNQVFENRSSGAYIFRPKPNTTERIVSRSADIKVMKGKYVDEVHQIFNDWISQVVRVYKSERFVEFEWLVGPIPIDDNTGKEISSRFYTNMKTNGIFYTDSNGREMLKRLRNHRPTWNVDLKEEIAGNYYPINTKVAIEDEEVRLSVLTDRAQGGSSVYDGTVELMVHRRLLHDDAFGVGEALNETAFGRGLVARGKHYLFLGKKFQKSPTLQAQERFLQNEVLIPSWLFFSDTSKMSYNEWTEKFTNIYSAIQLSLPKNIYLMTMEPWKQDSILVRFEHILEKNEDPEWSKPARFNFDDVFRNLDIADIREVTLAANQWIEDAVRFKFRTDSEKKRERFISLATKNTRRFKEDLEVILEPMQIRTFIIELNPSV